jgi:apolipoprotein N-acyltransferase
VFGEFIPFRAVLDDLQIGRLSMVGRDMLAGTREEPLRVGGLRVGDAICFDVAYDDGIYDQVADGAELLTVQTSNATFMGTRQLDQQFAMTRLRAIETGRWVAVASPNGISGIIAPDGSVAEQADQRTTDVMVQQVTLAAGVPPAVRLGAWPGLGALAVTLLALGAAALSYRRARRARTAEQAVLPPAPEPERASQPA